jgi:hypothetical protein
VTGVGSVQEGMLIRILSGNQMDQRAQIVEVRPHCVIVHIRHARASTAKPVEVALKAGQYRPAPTRGTL